MSIANFHFSNHWILPSGNPDFWVNQIYYESTVEESSEGVSPILFVNHAYYESVIEESPESVLNYAPLFLGQVLYESTIEEVPEASVMRSNDPDVVLLIHSNTTNGSTTFVDSSMKAHPINAIGQAQHSTAQSAFGSESSIVLDGTTDGLWIPDDSSFYFGSGNFTVDYRVRFADLTGTYRRMISIAESVGSDYSFVVDTNGAGDGLRMFVSADGTNITTLSLTSVFVTNTWYHMAIVRNGNTIYVYKDGTQIGTLDVTGITLFNSVGAVGIGSMATGGGNAINGYMDEIRIIKGRAAWTANFTPPTTRYT
jgi:hypothetical protein